METIFTCRTNSRVRPFDLLVKNRNTEKYSSEGFMALRTKICIALSENVKKNHPLVTSKNVLNRGQVQLANAKSV